MIRLSETLKTTTARASLLSFTAAMLWLSLGICSFAQVSRTTSDSAHDSEQHIAQLIQQLGAADFQDRRAAKWKLEEIGLDAFEQLRDAITLGDNPEISRAAQYIVNSQQVTWWLDTDSLEVRLLLADYNSLNAIAQSTRFQQLGELNSADALVALARFARYESDEYLSRRAAMELLEEIATIQQENQFSGDIFDNRERSENLIENIHLTIGRSSRPAVQWIRVLTKDLQHLSGVGSQDSEASTIDAWTAHADEQKSLASNANEQHQGMRQLSLSLYQWLGVWITGTVDRESALQLTRQCLPLVENDGKSLHDAALWTLSAELPELLGSLADDHKKAFYTSATLGFLLAESYVRLGQVETANRMAQATSESIGAIIKDKMANFAVASNLLLLESSQRFRQATLLQDRGMFLWAEREWMKVLELEQQRRDAEESNSYQQELETLSRLAYMYWSGGEHEKAAQYQGRLWKLVRETQFNAIEATYIDRNEIESYFHFYSGLAAIDRNQLVTAAQHLREAMKSKNVIPNPDVLIALKSIANAEPFNEYYREEMDRLVKQLRLDVVNAEKLLVDSARVQRGQAERSVAEACNQLAWLLACCEENTAEALSLSQRSLELAPEQTAYIDTLARCYFASGNIEKAIEVEKRVLQYEPHDRQFKAQLKMFEDALKAENIGADEPEGKLRSTESGKQ